MIKLDEFEQDILQSVENNEWERKGEMKERIAELQRTIKNQNKKALSIRVSENDLYVLKQKALENAIPYQNIIQMLIHQYSANKIRLSV
jgi:predicted DNA binding CopG/RHH family protein